MKLREKGRVIVDILKQHYPDTCSLVAEKDYQLLFSTRLAAQCTDARVNIVTKELYSRFPTVEALADADYEEICEIIRSCGLYRTKARDLKLGAQMIVREFGGRVPDTMEELLRIPGIGRKTANLMLSDFYGKPAIVADTHCIRISNRLGLIDPPAKDPYKVELALVDIIEPEEQASLCHRFVHFGRDICTARSPKCHLCPLLEHCPSAVTVNKES
ncbi:MAG: endonuclease III [Clostridia bacterium]|nr:endonuclease III [Clostridia bacterium]